jgi:hypothetical protein
MSERLAIDGGAGFSLRGTSVPLVRIMCSFHWRPEVCCGLKQNRAPIRRLDTTHGREREAAQ